MNHFDCNGLGYFGLKLARVKPLPSMPRVTLFQVFRRSLADGVTQGLSIGQVGKRHLLYVGTERGSFRLCLGFAWITRAHS